MAKPLALAKIFVKNSTQQPQQQPQQQISTGTIFNIRDKLKSNISTQIDEAIKQLSEYDLGAELNEQLLNYDKENNKKLKEDLKKKLLEKLNQPNFKLIQKQEPAPGEGQDGLVDEFSIKVLTDKEKQKLQKIYTNICTEMPVNMTEFIKDLYTFQIYILIKKFYDNFKHQFLEIKKKNNYEDLFEFVSKFININELLKNKINSLLETFLETYNSTFMITQQTNSFNDFIKKINDIKKNSNLNLQEHIKINLLKKQFNDAIDALNKYIETIKKNTELTYIPLFINDINKLNKLIPNNKEIKHIIKFITDNTLDNKEHIENIINNICEFIKKHLEQETPNEKLAREQQERLEEKEKAKEEESERLAKEESEKLKREQQEREEAERLAKEEAEKERLEAERLAKEESEKLKREEAERLAKEEAEKERLAKLPNLDKVIWTYISLNKVTNQNLSEFIKVILGMTNKTEQTIDDTDYEIVMVDDQVPLP
jgi:hypothetical protein